MAEASSIAAGSGNKTVGPKPSPRKPKPNNKKSFSKLRQTNKNGYKKSQTRRDNKSHPPLLTCTSFFGNSGLVEASRKYYFNNRNNIVMKFRVHRANCQCGTAKNLWNAIGSSKGNALGKPCHENKSLLLTPDVKSPKVYLHHKGPSIQNSMCITDLERSLHEIIQAESNLAKEDEVKVRCSACMLQQSGWKNACLVILGTKKDVYSVGELARSRRSYKVSEGNGLYHDHADFIVAIPYKVLNNAVLNSTRNSHKVLNECLLEQGLAQKKETMIDLSYNLREAVKNVNSLYKSTGLTVENEKQLFFLAMVFDRDSMWELNFPGGKRELGEQSWDCAVRETEEEMSLHISRLETAVEEESNSLDGRFYMSSSTHHLKEANDIFLSSVKTIDSKTMEFFVMTVGAKNGNTDAKETTKIKSDEYQLRSRMDELSIK